MANTSNTVVNVIVAMVILVAAILPFVNQSEKVVEQVQNNSQRIIKPDYQNEFLPDFSVYKDVKVKKQKFFDYLKPLVEDVNNDILQQRAFITSLQSYPTNKNDKQRFQALLKRYDVDVPKKSLKKDFKTVKAKLLRRVDVLPVALVLMQAANESAWGTSRFALQANNLFGQWCFKKGCGVVPKGRPKGKKYEVRKFNHPIESIRSYFHNLNSGHAYVELRRLREADRANGEKLSAVKLAKGLSKYSIRRDEYVTEIQNMIRVNRKYLQ